MSVRVMGQPSHGLRVDPIKIKPRKRKKIKRLQENTTRDTHSRILLLIKVTNIFIIM